LDQDKNRDGHCSNDFYDDGKLYNLENEVNINSNNYPKLRQSLNNSRFQNNLRPKSNNSRISGGMY
jgi:hypothetical protein